MLRPIARNVTYRTKAAMKSPDTDPNGSYTGCVTGEDGDRETPVQDADDL